MLHRHTGPAAQLGEHGGGQAVGGVTGRMLDDHAAVEHRGLVGVGQLGMVGMHAVAVVAGEHHALGQQAS